MERGRRLQLYDHVPFGTVSRAFIAPFVLFY